MHRIKLPNGVVKIGLNLFEKKKARGIIAIGTTDPYKAMNGIDQEEVLKENLEYEIEMEKTTDWARQLHKQQKIKFFMLAYADNIMKMVANKSMLRKITEIASEFFELNDIQINRKKSNMVDRKMKESLIRKKAHAIVRQFMIALNLKKLSLSQLVYVNNRCLLSKLSYILQLSKLPIKALNSIH
ncbi:1007_t:CDS:2 [Gigaspora margarita]|uniref:1007_t:CDS:1 n=1 Tax=Gigaspora margarita TaxID=4874 RepID=A0ABN7UXL9_GIGMA|nr:1007_t:CDS:2 [Gigaspora margarita]